MIATGGVEPATSCPEAPLLLQSHQTEFDNSVGFLLSKLGAEVARRFAGLMSDLDLEPRQFAILRMIASAQPDGNDGGDGGDLDAGRPDARRGHDKLDADAQAEASAGDSDQPREGPTGVAQHALAQALHIPASSLVSLIDELEERGLASRRLHPTDRRARMVELTATGEEVVTLATKVAMELEECVCAGLDPKARDRLIDSLRVVADNLAQPSSSAG